MGAEYQSSVGFSGRPLTEFVVAAMVRGGGKGYPVTNQDEKGAVMSENQALSHISEHRAAIDELDARIVALLNERAEHSLAIRALKPEAQLGLYDPKREEEIFAHLASVNNGPMYAEDVRAIYSTILQVMKGLRSR